MLRHTLLFIVICIKCGLYAQSNGYSVTLAPFSTITNDEFSPVYFNNGIVFCSNMRNNSLINYKSNHENLLNIFYVPEKGNNKWKSPQLLAKEITTNYNEGPITFNSKYDTAYFCRNNNILKSQGVSQDGNNLGIYSAVMVNGIWTETSLFKYNEASYSCVTPALSYNGKRLYFASDMPGGYGGADLYYCDWNDNEWDKPVNMGPVINTNKNESYPYACKSGKLFFASEGHPGLGGKDLFYSQEIDGTWLSPIHLDSIINSPFDDFGLITDIELTKGFFSSNRLKTDDIFKFEANPIIFPACDSMVKNNYCFLFYDEFRTQSDSIPVKYFWDFGNNTKKEGIKVKNCFPGPGKYLVKLIITDGINKDSIISETPYEFELKDKEQIYINTTDEGIAGSTMTFDGLKTNLQNFQISDYIWDFGEGYLTRGPLVTKVFDKKGEYTIHLGLVGRKDTLSEYSKVCSFKRIKIFDDYQEMAVETGKGIKINESDNLVSDNSSKTEKNVRAKKKSDLFVIKNYLLNDLSEIQKEKIINDLNPNKTFTFEIQENGIDTASFSLLNNYVTILNKNREMRLEIALHTNEGSSAKSQEISEKWAQDVFSYFSGKGITDKDLHCKGYGSSRTPNLRELKNEKRIEFIFLNK